MLSRRALIGSAAPLGVSPALAKSAAPAPRTEIIDAFGDGPASPQSAKDEAQSEDCLFLNVWPRVADAGNRAVMLYFHGGAYNSGSGSSPLYDGRRLAAKGDAVVTVNHRLNAFGYLISAGLSSRTPAMRACGTLPSPSNGCATTPRARPPLPASRHDNVS